MVFFCGLSKADLIIVDADNDIYKTTTGGQEILWYLNLSATFNKTCDEQIAFAEGLDIGGFDDWHMATATEIDQLLDAISPQPELVFDAINDSGTSPYYNQFQGRYNEVDPDVLGKHRYGRVYYDTWDGKYYTLYGGTNLYPDVEGYANVGAWISHVVPIPGAVVLGILGLGTVGLRLRKYL